MNQESQLFEVQFGKISYDLKNYSYLSVEGPDSKEFLQRQLTNDVNDLSLKTSQLSARLTRSGRIHSFFYLAKVSTGYLLCLENQLVEKLKEELEKFIIMEDVTLKILDTNTSVLIGEKFSKADYEKSLFEGIWCNQRALFFDHCKSDEKKLDEEMANCLILATAWPVIDKTLNGDELINETTLNDRAVSYNKGCFQGQETVAKIETRRGAARYPTLVKLDKSYEEVELSQNPRSQKWGMFTLMNENYLLVSLPREARVVGRSIVVNGTDCEVIGLDLIKLLNKGEKADLLYNKAVKQYHSKNFELAIELLNTTIAIDATYADAYESKGAILGQMEKYEEAIATMDELLSVDENSVMAHTNKSLFFMKIGKIEEAEEEKSLATVANFQRLGAQASKKKTINDENKKKQAEILRRKEMFKKVLAMDSNDEIANYGIADILYSEKEYEQALQHLEVVLEQNEKYSVAYLLSGKSFEALGMNDEAKKLYEVGITVATKHGDMMPANEMQSRLNTLGSNDL